MSDLQVVMDYAKDSLAQLRVEYGFYLERGAGRKIGYRATLRDETGFILLREAGATADEALHKLAIRVQEAD